MILAQPNVWDVQLPNGQYINLSGLTLTRLYALADDTEGYDVRHAVMGWLRYREVEAEDNALDLDVVEGRLAVAHVR